MGFGLFPNQFPIYTILNIKNLNKFKQQGKNLSFYLLASIFTSLIGVLINPFMAANLSPDDYAILGYFTSFNLLVTPIINFSLISYYSKNYFLIQEGERQRVVDTLIIAQLLIGFILLFVVLTAFFVYMKIAEVSFQFFPYALLTFLPLFFNCFYSLYLVDLRMKREARKFFNIVLINGIVGAAVAILFVVVLKGGATGRLFATFLTAIPFSFFAVRKLFGSLRFDIHIVKQAISFGWPISLSAILMYFFTGIDRAFLERLGDSYTLGIYNVAAQLTGYLYIFYSAIIHTLDPDIYQAVAEGQKQKLKKIVVLIIILNAIPSLIFILLAEPVVSILTYGRYTASVPYAKILAIKNIPMSICFIISSLNIAYGYARVELVNRLFGAAAGIILFKILIGKYNFFGAAWVQSIAFSVMALIGILVLLYKQQSGRDGKFYDKRKPNDQEISDSDNRG